MPKPANLDELCAVLQTYFQQQYEWQQRVNLRLKDLEPGGHQGDDPPPPPPDFG